MEQIILNLVPGGVSPVCYVSQYDVGRKIRLHLRNGSDPYVLSGAETVTATIRKVSGEELIYDIANTSASYVDLIVNYDATDVIGESVCELIITESGLRIGSANFKMRVDPDVYSGDQKLEVVTASSPNSLLSFETNIDENLLELKAGLSPVQEGTPWIDSNVVNKEPYIKRAVAGTATRIGNHLYDKLVGGTVAWNQLVPTEITTCSITIDEDVVSNKWGRKIGNMGVSAIGHKVIGVDIYENSKCRVAFGANTNAIIDGSDASTENNKTAGVWIGESHKIQDGAIYFRLIAGLPAGTYTNHIMFIDLTAMFGSTIADYIYSLEQATAGAGVAWFKALFPNDYYAYNAGELMSVKATAHVMKNASNTVIGNYALDNNLVLNGLFKLDVNNKLYADGDTYESSGLVTRGYMLVNLGTTSWRFVTSANNVYLFIAEIPNIVSRPASNYTIKAITNNPKISIGTQATWTSSMYQLSGYNSGANAILFTFDNNSASDVADFMNGTYLVCEVETPTTEQASPFTNPQVCDENGTEEYTDNRTVAIPVGHETYQANICPINGCTEANITRCGVNLFDKTATDGNNGYIANAYIRNNGTKISDVDCDISEYIRVSGNTEITLKPLMFSNPSLCFYDISKNFISGENYNSRATVTTTTPANCAFIRFSIIKANIDTTQLELGNQATPYTPYNGTTVTISFGQTVYGGVLDVTRGKLHVTWGTVDLGGLTYYYSSIYQRFSTDDIQSVIKIPPNDNTAFNGLCSIYTSVSRSTIGDNNYVMCVFNTGTLAIKNSDYSDANVFKTAMSGIYLAYELATPFDIDLTPVQISAIVGVNNLTHDANGGTEVKFFRLIPAS